MLAMIGQGALLFIIKLLSFDTPPLLLLSYQYVGSLIMITLYLIIKNVSFKLKRVELLKILFTGFLVSTGLSFYYLAISLSDASKVVPLHNVGITLLPAILAFIYLKEKINKKIIAGLICSVLCIIFLTI
jgi:uncharacterized membrane protein